MTEKQWLAATDPGAMLACVRATAGERKLRLYACACFRAVASLLSDDDVQPALTVAERLADGLASLPEVARARQAAWGAVERYFPGGELDAQGVNRAIIWGLRLRVEILASAVPDSAIRVVQEVVRAIARDDPQWGRRVAGDGARARLMGHLFGNPFRPYPGPASWPALVVDLAQQLYDGAAVRPILHDALLDTGHAELADHFRQEQAHPKGCWVLDLILDKR